MKIAEIKEIPTNDLVERVEAEVTNYNQIPIYYLQSMNANAKK